MDQYPNPEQRQLQTTQWSVLLLLSDYQGRLASVDNNSLTQSIQASLESPDSAPQLIPDNEGDYYLTFNLKNDNQETAVLNGLGATWNGMEAAGLDDVQIKAMRLGPSQSVNGLSIEDAWYERR
jgi:hypothetical protein